MPSKKTGFSKTSKPYSKESKAGGKAAKGASVSEKTSTFGKKSPLKDKEVTARSAGAAASHALKITRDATSSKAAAGGAFSQKIRDGKSKTTGGKVYKPQDPPPDPPTPKPRRK